MKRWKTAVLLLALLLCACGGTQTAPDVSEPAEPPAQAEVPVLSWDALAWDEHLELAYAQSFTVDYAQEGFARITIDNIVHLLVPEGACASPCKTFTYRPPPPWTVSANWMPLMLLPSPVPRRTVGTSRKPVRLWRTGG